jgi:hypothetical protein
MALSGFSGFAGIRREEKLDGLPCRAAIGFVQRVEQSATEKSDFLKPRSRRCAGDCGRELSARRRCASSSSFARGIEHRLALRIRFHAARRSSSSARDSILRQPLRRRASPNCSHRGEIVPPYLRFSVSKTDTRSSMRRERGGLDVEFLRVSRIALQREIADFSDLDPRMSVSENCRARRRRIDSLECRAAACRTSFEPRESPHPPTPRCAPAICRRKVSSSRRLFEAVRIARDQSASSSSGFAALRTSISFNLMFRSNSASRSSDGFASRTARRARRRDALSFAILIPRTSARSASAPANASSRPSCLVAPRAATGDRAGRANPRGRRRQFREHGERRRAAVDELPVRSPRCAKTRFTMSCPNPAHGSMPCSSSHAFSFFASGKLEHGLDRAIFRAAADERFVRALAEHELQRADDDRFSRSRSRR